MSEEKTVRFVSKHADMTIMRKPQQVTRSVNGVMQIVTEDRTPFKFQSGNLAVTEEEAKEIRSKRGFGTLYEEIPEAVKKVASKKKTKEPEPEPKPEPVKEPEPAKDPQPVTNTDSAPEPEPKPEPVKEPEPVEAKVVEEVTSFNEAVAYLKEEWGKDHSEVNSKAKIDKQIAALGIEFPNYE